MVCDCGRGVVDYFVIVDLNARCKWMQSEKSEGAIVQTLHLKANIEVEASLAVNASHATSMQ